MKRRALSLFMALALCLSLLPAPLLAVETGAALGADGGTDDAYAIGEDAAAPEDGVAPLANEAGVVSVTVNGETTEYSDIIEAFESVGKTGSATVKLLDDAYLRENKERPTFPGKIELPAVHLSQAVRSNTAFLAPEEIKKFIAVIKEDQEFAVPALLALSSLRMSEIAALRWEDIPEKPEFIRVRGSVVKDENNCYVNKKQNKNISSARNVPILIPELQAVIARDRKLRGPVLKGQNRFRKAVRRACCTAGVTDVTVHGLRHSFATLAYHLRIPEKITMEIGGWADSGTMNRIYTHIAKSDFNRYRDLFGDFYRAR